MTLEQAEIRRSGDVGEGQRGGRTDGREPVTIALVIAGVTTSTGQAVTRVIEFEFICPSLRVHS